MICPNCGKEIDENSVYCEYCGKNINDINNYHPSNNETETTSVNPTKKVKLVLMWIMIIIALIFMFIAFIIDYGTALSNEENFWFGQYVTAAIFHTLCALFFLKLAQLLHK